MKNEALLRNLINLHFDVDEEKITDGASLIDDLGLDSLDTVELVMVIEEELKVAISDDEAESITTFSDLVTIVDRKRGSSF